MLPHDLNVDLHMHSTASDGVVAPAELPGRGLANGVQIMALTDHDSLAGLAACEEAAVDQGIRFVNGVEISVTWASTTLHLVGLNFDRHHPNLIAGLEGVQSSRLERARLMDESLIAAGYPSVFDHAMSYADNPSLIGRTHFARALVAEGVCKTIQDVFDRFLTPGKPGYVPHEWARLPKAMDWILSAGGLPVLAHPARYKLSETAHWCLLQEFMSLGGGAIEVATGSHGLDDTKKYQRIALELGLEASRGSDFHSPTESRCDVGLAPPLPDGTHPIWTRWMH